jgi:hypothetical protein
MIDINHKFTCEVSEFILVISRGIPNTLSNSQKINNTPDDCIPDDR